MRVYNQPVPSKVYFCRSLSTCGRKAVVLKRQGSRVLSSNGDQIDPGTPSVSQSESSFILTYRHPDHARRHTPSRQPGTHALALHARTSLSIASNTHLHTRCTPTSYSTHSHTNQPATRGRSRDRTPMTALITITHLKPCLAHEAPSQACMARMSFWHPTIQGSERLHSTETLPRSQYSCKSRTLSVYSYFKAYQAA